LPNAQDELAVSAPALAASVSGRSLLQREHLLEAVPASHARASANAGLDPSVATHLLVAKTRARPTASHGPRCLQAGAEKRPSPLGRRDRRNAATSAA
jgi:hypothetical protein